MAKENEPFESHGVVLIHSFKWEYDLYGFYPNRVGDSISWMMWKACYDPAYVKYIPICASLLKEGKRWPDALNHPRMAKTVIRYGWSKILYWTGIKPDRLYRTQHKLTRDPYTYFFAACKINDMWKYGKYIHPPRSIYSPTFWAWQKYLHTGEERYRLRYIRREYRGIPARQYVKDMALVRALAAGPWELYWHINNLEVKPDKG